MHETIPQGTPAGQEELDTPEKDSGNIEGEEQLAAGIQSVLEHAVENGEPSSKTIETNEGVMGYVGASIPGGRLEAMFRGEGTDADLRALDITLDGDPEHSIGVVFSEGGEAEVYVDGKRVKPEEVPAIQKVIEQITREQGEKFEPEDSKEGDDHKDEKDKRRDIEELRRALDELRVKELKNKSNVDNLMQQVQGLSRALNILGDGGRGQIGFQDAVRKTQRDIEGFIGQLRNITRAFEENESKALALQDRVSETTGSRLHVVRSSDEEFGRGGNPPMLAAKRLAGIEVRQQTYVADLQGQLRSVIALLEKSKPINSRILQSKAA